MSQVLNSYVLLMRWQLLGLKAIMPFIVVIQTIIAVGVVFGLSFMYPSIDALSAKFIVTGATTLTLTSLGLVMIPQNVAQMKERKTFDYLWSLPIHRLVYLFADFTVWLGVIAPGVVIALLVGSAKYGFALDISPLAVPAFLLVALTGVAVGMSYAHLSPSPVLTGVISNVIIFSLFLFSPVNFPLERLPVGLYHIHLVLPVKYMADLVRGTLTNGPVDSLGVAFGVVGAWCAISLISLYVVFTRRR